jgi:hypothetical protein
MPFSPFIFKDLKEGRKEGRKEGWMDVWMDGWILFFFIWSPYFGGMLKYFL